MTWMIILNDKRKGPFCQKDHPHAYPLGLADEAWGRDVPDNEFQRLLRSAEAGDHDLTGQTVVEYVVLATLSITSRGCVLQAGQAVVEYAILATAGLLDRDADSNGFVGLGAVAPFCRA